MSRLAVVAALWAAVAIAAWPQAVASLPMLPHFFHSVNASVKTTHTLAQSVAWLDNVSHHRVLPGFFPEGITYHFDGLTAALSVRFGGGEATTRVVPFDSGAYEHFDRCLFLGAGTEHTGVQPCLQNPSVNLLPINGQFWLTIDQVQWGRIDPETLERLDAKAINKAGMFILNAHPACDHTTNECFVEHGLFSNDLPTGSQVGVSVMRTSDTDITAELLSTNEIPGNTTVTLQHSHSPCVTEHYVVAKIDSFELRPREPRANFSRHGTLKTLRQREAGWWVVHDRRTNTSQTLTSSLEFVNNHFWNCYEEEGTGDIVVETVPATHGYLDTYFKGNLELPVAPWGNMFTPPQACRIDAAQGTVACQNLFRDPAVVFDYPTFNPAVKMSDYRYFYGISPASTQTSRWFDRVIKVDRHSGIIAAQWSEPGVFPTEAGFIGRPGGVAEDDGVLLTVVLNSTSNSSFGVLLDAATLEKLDQFPFDQIVPFHAHGISCVHGHCHSNP